MAQFFEVHPDNPQPRLLKQAAEIINGGGVAAIPTDSCFSLVCHLDDKNAVDRLRRIRGITDKHHLALMCRDLSDLGSYAKVNNVQYRLLKSVTPGPYTFILDATKEVPKRVSHPSKRSVGLRVPDHKVVQGILEYVDGALITSTCQLPDMDEPFIDAESVRDALENLVDLIISDDRFCQVRPTTVIDWTGSDPVVVRLGSGPLEGPLAPIDVEVDEALR